MYILHVPSELGCCKKKSSTSWVGMSNRVRSRFFVQAGHETTYAFSGNKHFFHHIRSLSAKIGHIFRK